MRIKKNYLTLLAITLAVIILCFMLPSALFQFYDTEWTEKRVEKSANVSGLNIDSMSLSEKIQLIYNLDTIEAALNGETDTSLEVAVLSRGYKLTKEEAWSNIITEFMKLADGLETLMPEFYKYIASIQDYNDAMKYTDSDAILPILVTDQKGNSTILWVMAFQMDSYFAAEQPSDGYPMPFAQLYYDESSGYLLGMEIYDLDMSQLEDFELNILQDANEETTELPLEQRIAGCFLKRYANYVGWDNSRNQMDWSYMDYYASLEISNGNEALDLKCYVFIEDCIDAEDHFMLNIKLNRES